MQRPSKTLSLWVMAGLVLLLAAIPALAHQQTPGPQQLRGSSPQDLTAKEAQEIAIDAYICGYSLITSEVIRVQMTKVRR